MKIKYAPELEREENAGDYEVVEMRMKGLSSLFVTACVFLASGMVAGDCVKNVRGGTDCSNGQSAAAYNPRTGNAAVAQKNQNNGVTTTQTSKGGEAKTKNGKGVAQGPNGTTCAKGKYNSGCKE